MMQSNVYAYQEVNPALQSTRSYTSSMAFGSCMATVHALALAPAPDLEPLFVHTNFPLTASQLHLPHHKSAVFVVI